MPFRIKLQFFSRKPWNILGLAFLSHSSFHCCLLGNLTIFFFSFTLHIVFFRHCCLLLSLTLSAVIWNFTVIKQCVALAMLLFSVASWTLVFSSSVWFSLFLCEWIIALGSTATTLVSLIPKNISFVSFEVYIFIFCFWFLFVRFLLF